MSVAAPPTSITLTIGQPVRWRPAPAGFAQIDELRRTKVRLVYVTRRGSLRFPIVPASSVELGDVLPLTNLLERGALRRSKTFSLKDVTHEPD